MERQTGISKFGFSENGGVILHGVVRDTCERDRKEEVGEEGIGGGEESR